MLPRRRRRPKQKKLLSPFEPARPATSPKVGTVVRRSLVAHQHWPITPDQVEAAVAACNELWDGKYVLSPQWDSGERSGGVLACTRRQRRLIAGCRGALRVRLEFCRWRKSLKELLPRGTERFTVLSTPTMQPYHRIRLEADPEVRPWTKQDERVVVPALCQALGLDPARGLGVCGLQQKGLPTLERAAALMFSDAPVLPRPLRVRTATPPPDDADDEIEMPRDAPIRNPLADPPPSRPPQRFKIPRKRRRIQRRP